MLIDRITRRLVPANRLGRAISFLLHRIGSQQVARYTSRFSKYVPVKVKIGCFREGEALRTLYMLGLSGDDHIARFAWCYGARNYEYPLPEMFIELCRNSCGVAFVGANTGFYVLQIAATSPKSQLVAFEPYERARSALIMNLKLNELRSRVEVVPMAVSDRCGHEDFVLPVPRFGTTIETSGTLEKNFHSADQIGRVQRIQVTTIDTWRFTRNKPIDVIQMDVEGHETTVLNGASRTIECDRPHIFLELLPKRSSAVEKVGTFCQQNQYLCFQLRHQGIVQTKQIVPDKAAPNQWLIPFERVEPTSRLLRGAGFDVDIAKY